MKVRFVIDTILVDVPGGIDYKPIGVWAVDGERPPTGFDFKYLPGNPEREEFANIVAERIVEIGAPTLPDGFLVYHQASYPSHIGTFGGIFVGDYPSVPACCDSVLQLIEQNKLSTLGVGT